MKLIGFILITLSSALCGFCYTSGRREHAESLASFCLMLEMLHAEIKDKLCPIPELSKSLSNKINGSAGNFLSLLSLNLAFLGEKNFEGIWCESLCAAAPELNDSEYESVAGLGKTLGKYDAQTQAEAISEVLASLRDSYTQVCAELPQINRLSMGVSVSAGALLAILLV